MRLVIYLLILFVIGCSKQSAKNSTKLEISSAALIAGHSGGVMLYVINKDKGTQRSLALNDNKVTLELDNGNWDFAVLAWNTDLGSKESLECAKASIKLEDSSREVNLNLSYDACNDSFFSPPEYLDSSQVLNIIIKTKELKLLNCRSVSAITAGGAGCTERGFANSYRLKLLGHPETPLNSFSNLSITQANSIQSINCVNTSVGVDTILGKKIPFGSAYFKPAIVLEAFNQVNCAGEKRSYFFPNGLAGTEVIANKAKVFINGSLAELYVDYGSVSLTPSLSFPATTVGTTSGFQTMILSNFTSSPITINSFNLQPPFQIYTASTTCLVNQTLDPAQSCVFALIFSPINTGIFNIPFNIQYNANQTVSSALQGNGLSPANVTTDITSLNFVNVLTHTNPIIIDITFTNSGETPATNFTFTMPSGFVYNATTCNDAPINQGQSCTLTIKSTYNNTIVQQDTNLSVSYNTGSLSPAPILQIPVSINYVATGDGATTGMMSPFYSTFTNSNYWNTYVNDTTPYYYLSSVECIPGTDTICQHAGDKRVTKLPSVFDTETCSNLIGSDTLNVFDWQCLGGSGSQMSFRILGFKKSKGLRDLIDPATSNWRTIQFKVTKDNTLVYQNREPSNNIWWGNPIKNINALDGYQYGANDDFTNLYSSLGVFALKNTGDVITTPASLHAFDLGSSKNIYVVSQDISVPAIHFGATNVSLVTLGNAKITSNAGNNNICNMNTGGVAGANGKTLICVGGTAGQKHPWIEIKANGYNQLSARAIYLKQPRFSRVHNTEVANGTIGIEYQGADKYNLLTDSEFHHNDDTGMLNSQSTGTVETLSSSFHDNNLSGIRIDGSTNARIKDVHTYQNGDGVYITGGGGHSLENLKSTQNISNGVYATNTLSLRVFSSHLSSNDKRGIFFRNNAATSNNIIHDSILSGNCRDSGSSFFGALQFSNSIDSNAYNLLVTGNQCYGVRMDMGTVSSLEATRNRLQNSTLVNNDDGIFISNASHNMLLNVVSANNKLGSGFGTGLFVDNSSNNKFVNFVSSKNNTGVRLNNAFINSFEKLLLIGSNQGNVDCDITNSTPNILQTIDHACSSSTTNTTIIPNINVSDSFVGLADDDSKNSDAASIMSGTINFSSITDFFNFDNFYRLWGSKNATLNGPFEDDNGGACTSSGDCGIWDWRLKSSDTVLRNSSVNGIGPNAPFTTAPCPIYLNDTSSIISDTQATPNFFLYRAVEVAFDSIGNDNGLCEATEACIYSPNFGYYQGEGGVTNACVTDGTNGGLSNIKVRSYLTNGAP